MTTEQLSKTEWKKYFDHLSKVLADRQVEVEVSSPEIGHQIEARWGPIHGMSYDPRDDTVEIFLDDLDHIIHHPRAIYVEYDESALRSMENVEEDDTRQIIRLRKMPPGTDPMP